MSHIKAVIFDMDGLLIDTESHAKIAWQHAAKAMGLDIDEETMLGFVGRHIDDCLNQLSEKFNRDLRADGFMERVDDIYFSNFMRHGIGVKSGAVDLLEDLRANDIPRAVATSSEQGIAPRKLRLAGLEHYFPIVVTGCEVEKSKPAPDIFLLTAEKLGVDPEHCLVLEDSYTGIEGATNAGMTVIMIPDMLPPADETTRRIHGVYDSLGHAHPEVKRLLAPMN